MNPAGFDYAPAVAFPAEDTRQIAESLGIDAAGSGSATAAVSPRARDHAYEVGLSAAEPERYNQTLLGESAADVAESDRTDEVPDGRLAVDFATGGCVGAAKAAIPSIWDTPRQLDAELAAIATTDSACAQRRAADTFVDRQTRRLTAAAARYDGVMTQIATDATLATYLATQVCGVALSVKSRALSPSGGASITP